MGSTLMTWLRAAAPAWFATIWKYLKMAVAAVWKSFAALLKSPAAWLACGALTVGGFYIGHIEGSSDGRAALKTVAGIERDKAELQRQLDASKIKVRMLATELEKLAQKPQEVAPLVSAPTPAQRPRRAPRATPAPAKAVPAPTFRNPFEG